MDGQAITQEETEAMFSKITSVLDYLRNQLVNNTELAKQVQSLTQQVNDLTSQIHSVVGQNTALQEAVNVLTRERDEERDTNKQLSDHNRDLQEKFNQRDNDANHWYAQFNAISAELEKVKQERSDLESEHLKLMDEHEKARAKLAQISALFPAMAPTPVVEEVPEPQPQPRDPLTQQWRSPYDPRHDERQVG